LKLVPVVKFRVSDDIGAAGPMVTVALCAGGAQVTKALMPLNALGDVPVVRDEKAEALAQMAPRGRRQTRPYVWAARFAQRPRENATRGCRSRTRSYGEAKSGRARALIPKTAFPVMALRFRPKQKTANNLKETHNEPVG